MAGAGRTRSDDSGGEYIERPAAFESIQVIERQSFRPDWISQDKNSCFRQDAVLFGHARPIGLKVRADGKRFSSTKSTLIKLPIIKRYISH